ncbi:MAG: four-helix bundle copper-binding protein [Dehalococcoidia bacterium]
MSYARDMIETTPVVVEFDPADLTECIEACFDCLQACTACADACLGEERVAELVACIRLNLDCADVCETTGKMLSRQTEYDPALVQSTLQTCALACQVCGDECDSHSEMHEHCRVCADACRRCEAACQKLIDAAAA